MRKIKEAHIFFVVRNEDAVSDAELPIPSKVKKLREKNEEEDSLNETDEEKVNKALQHFSSNLIAINSFLGKSESLQKHKIAVLLF